MSWNLGYLIYIFAYTLRADLGLCVSFLLLLFKRFYLFERESKSESEKESRECTQREGEADSPLSTEPEVGLRPTTQKS